MRVAIVSTYRPRPCGIAVFSADLRAALLEGDSSSTVEIVSIVRDEPHAHPPEVVATIRQDVASDYAAAPSELRRRSVDVVLVEHEYGIFGGDVGSYILKLTNELSMPMVVTLHTVLANPSPDRAEVLRTLCGHAVLVMVFTETARRMVIEQGLAESEQVRVIPHGAPDELTQAAWSDRVGEDLNFRPLQSSSVSMWGSTAEYPPPVGNMRTSSSSLQLGLPSLAGRSVLSTFGLISDSKGLEMVIDALPSITAAHPHVLYLIAGQTHPDVIHREGESYRLGLRRLVHDLDLYDHVSFIDRFLTIDELAMLLARTDLYVTPYRSKDQIVSGALTFAVAAGCPVVSTPYFYAEDLLSSGAGVLVPFGDSSKLATAVLDLLGSPAKLSAARTEARRVGADLTWANVGKATLEVLAEAAHGVQVPAALERSR
jgi:glycosyltransferase involved in cell wall biosynthesis